jgi:hypothetical protein
MEIQLIDGGTYTLRPRKPRKPRTTPAADWPLDRQHSLWTREEDEELARDWPDPTLTTEEVCRRRQRSRTSVAIRATSLKLGPRPKEQTYQAKRQEAAAPRPPKPPPPPKPPKPQPEVDESKPVALAQTVDGVVLTAKLLAAWRRVEAGEDVRKAVSMHRLSAVEAAALRRWREG